MTCEHTEFITTCCVLRMEEWGSRMIAQIKINCAECNMPLAFLGLPGGLSNLQATVSADCLEVRVPMVMLEEVRGVN